MSLTSVVFKVLENIREKLVKQSTDNCLLTDSHEFRKNRSFLINIISYLDKLVNDVDNDNYGYRLP